MKVFEIFDRDHALEGAATQGHRFLDCLEQVSRKHPSIGHTNFSGLYLDLELVLDRKTKQSAGDKTGRVVNELLRQGVVCMHFGYFCNRVCSAPRLVITEAEIDQALGEPDQVLGGAEKKFGVN